jgi:hypothetical protein
MTDGPWTVPDLWTRRRAHRSLENRADAVSHTAHRHHRMRKGERKRRRKTDRTSSHYRWRRTPDNLSRSSASLRSDHDAAVPVITMTWTD